MHAVSAQKDLMFRYILYTCALWKNLDEDLSPVVNLVGWKSCPHLKWAPEKKDNINKMMTCIYSLLGFSRTCVTLERIILRWKMYSVPFIISFHLFSLFSLDRNYCHYFYHIWQRIGYGIRLIEFEFGLTKNKFILTVVEIKSVLTYEVTYLFEFSATSIQKIITKSKCFI